MQEAHSLVLEVLKLDNALKMSVFEQKELTSTLKHFSQCSVSFAEVGKLCHEVVSILNTISKRGDRQEALTKDLQKTGQLLWEHLLTRPVKETLKAAKASDLVLSLDEELIDIPWELLYDGSTFLCLNFNLGRVVRTREQGTVPQYRSPEGAARMLILANPTSDLKSAYLEGVFIKNQLDHKRKEIIINFKSTLIDTLYVKKNLGDYDIVHFAGHCEYDSESPRNSGWVFNDGRFTAQDILTMGETFSLPTLVFSNACYSARPVARDTIDRDYQQKSYNFASAFLYSGVRHYVGAMRKIEDPVSLVFAKEFYTQLISGKSVGECVRQSRFRLIKEYGLSASHWASYLLYGDPNFVLFKSPARALKLKKRRNFASYRKPLVFASFVLVFALALLRFYAWLPSRNPNTYILYARSQKLFDKGENNGVISISSTILAKDPSFLPAYPLLAETYQRQGDRANALKSYFNYAFFSEKRNDPKSLASAYIGIGWTYYLDGDYPKAFDFYSKAVSLSQKSRDKLNEAAALRKLSVWYMDKKQDDKALELLTRSAEINRERINCYAHKANLARDYFNIGLLFTNKEDLATAKDFYGKSLKLFSALKLKYELSDCYFNLGEIYKMEKQYQNAMDCYMQGLKADQDLSLAANIAGDYDMIGELYMEMGDSSQAEKYFIQALGAARQIDADLEVASASFNLGLLYKQKGHKNKAREYFRKAQEIYSKVDTLDYEKVKKELLSLE